MVITRRIIFSAFLLLAFLVSFTQDVIQKTTPSGDSIVISAIPLADIPDRLESTRNRVKQIEEDLTPKGDLAVFDSIYKIYVDEMGNKKKRLEKREGDFSLLSINNDASEWINLKDASSKMQEKVKERVILLQTDLSETEVLKETWSLTITSAQKGGVPASVLTSGKEVLTSVKSLNKKVQRAQTEALRKQDQIANLIKKIDEVLADLEKQKAALQKEYFIQDSPPIWRAGDSTTNLGSVKNQIRQNKDESLRSLDNFYNENEAIIYFHLLIFLLLWLGLYLLHRKTLETFSEDGNTDVTDSKEIISHYLLSSLVISLFISIWLYPSNFPTDISHLIQFTYIIISLILLPRYLDKKMNRVLIGLLVLFLLNQMQMLFAGKVLFARLMIFLEIFLAGYLLFQLINPKGMIRGELKRHKWGFLLKIIPVFYFFLGVAAIANIMGYVNLSVLLNNTIVNALFTLNIVILAITVLNRVSIILIRTPFMQDSNVIKNHTENIEKRFFQVIQIITVYLWFQSILNSLGLHENFIEWLNTFISQQHIVGDTTIDMGGILTFFLVIVVTIIVFRFVKLVLAEELFPRVKLPRGVPGSISMISGYVIVGYGFFTALSAGGVDLSTFGLVAGALGVGIGFGLQGIVANFIAGVVLAFERPIQVGDEIELPQTMGMITNIGVRSTTLRTYDGSEVIIPNSDLITKDVINWTLSDRKKRRDIYIGVAYGSDPEVVLELIKKVASENPNVLNIPAPWALFDGFGDSALNFRIRIWTTMDTGMTTKSEVTKAIYDALGAAGISIPFPQRDLHLKSLAPDVQKELTKKASAPKAKTTRKAPPGKPTKENES